MRKGLFSKNGLCKIIVTSAVFALAAVTVPSHISSLSVVHADSETANRSVSIQEIDTNNSTDDSESDATDNGTQNDNSDSFLMIRRPPRSTLDRSSAARCSPYSASSTASRRIIPSSGC